MKLSVVIFCIFCAFPWPQTPLHGPDLTKLEQSVRDQIETAQKALTAVVKDPATSQTTLSEAYGRLGQIYHAYSLNSSARECYLNAGTLAPKDFRWVYLLGKLDQNEGHFEDAIRRYQLARALRPDYVAALVNLGNIFLELNRLQDATESFNAALKIDERTAAARYGLGQVALSRRRYSEAVDHFERTLAQVPAANRVHYSLAMAYRGLGAVEKVKAHLAQQGPVGVRVSDPLVDGLQDLIEGERVHLARGKMAFEAHSYVEAASEFRKAVAASPNSVTARMNLGAALTQVGDLPGAAEQFEEVLRLEPEKANAHYNLAVVLARQNKHEEAIVHLQSALTAAPNDVDARFLLARELTKLQRWDEALEALEKGHAQHPEKVGTAVVLAYLLATAPQLELRNGSRALNLAQGVYKVTGALKHGAVVAVALAELGRCNEAAELQRQLIAAAEEKRDTNLLTRLRASLKTYENSQACRPTETSLLDSLFL